MSSEIIGVSVKLQTTHCKFWPNELFMADKRSRVNVAMPHCVGGNVVTKTTLDTGDGLLISVFFLVLA